VGRQKGESLLSSTSLTRTVISLANLLDKILLLLT
jgi:hypothetical protein